MTMQRDFDRHLSNLLEELAVPAVPDYVDDVLVASRQAGQRSVVHSLLARPVGSITRTIVIGRTPARLFIIALTLLLLGALALGGSIVGSWLERGRTNAVVPPELPAPVEPPRTSATSGPVATLPPATSGDPARLVVEHWNGLVDPDSSISHVAFAPGSADGTTLDTLPDNATGVRWAPDGTRVAYTTVDAQVRNGLGGPRPRLAATDVLVADRDGSNPVRVELPRAMRMYGNYQVPVVWSPDGTRFALPWDTGSCSGGPDCLPDGGIDIFDATGQLLTTIDLPDNWGPEAIWSADGRAIGWTTGSCTEEGTCVGEAFNWRLVEGNPAVTTISGLFLPSIWAPDGRLYGVAMTSDGGYPEEVLSMAADGSDVRRVDWAIGPRDAFPFWSPDGRWLVAVDRQGMLRLRDVFAGTEVSRPLPSVLYIGDWSPDSRSIALFGDSVANPSGSAYFMVTVDGGEVIAVGDGEDVAWLPGGVAR